MINIEHFRAWKAWDYIFIENQQRINLHRGLRVGTSNPSRARRLNIDGLTVDVDRLLPVATSIFSKLIAIMFSVARIVSLSSNMGSEEPPDLEGSTTHMTHVLMDTARKSARSSGSPLTTVNLGKLLILYHSFSRKFGLPKKTISLRSA